MKRFSTNQEYRITDLIYDTIIANNPEIDDNLELANKWYDLVQEEVGHVIENLFENN